MRFKIEFYIPIEKLQDFNRGGVVMYTSYSANGLIKIEAKPTSIVFIQKVNSNIFYIRKATFLERIRLRRKGKL